jgi:cytidine deaminase
LGFSRIRKKGKLETSECQENAKQSRAVCAEPETTHKTSSNGGDKAIILVLARGDRNQAFRAIG